MISGSCFFLVSEILWTTACANIGPVSGNRSFYGQYYLINFYNQLYMHQNMYTSDVSESTCFDTS